jgi:hypothetical protein
LAGGCDVNKERPKISHIRRPLRRAGQYLDEQSADILTGPGLTYAILFGFGISFPVIPWLQAALGVPFEPVAATVIGGLCAAIGLLGAKRTATRLRRVELGSRAEKVVADMLEPLRELSCAVFHDLPGDGFNVDHIVVGPGGVFVIETKGRSKRGGTTVTYRNGEIRVDGHAPDRDPIRQVKALGDWLFGLVRERCALEPPIRGVVVYPGWYIEGSSSGRDVWVLNEKALPAFIGNSAHTLTPEEVERIAAMLSAKSRGE